MKGSCWAALGAFAVAAISGTGAIAHQKTVDWISTMRSTSRCVAENAPREVATLLNTLPGSREEKSAARRTDAAFTACAEGSWRLKTGDQAGLREALAVAMVAERPAGAPHMSATPWYQPISAGRSPGTGYDPALLGREELGTCIAVAAPEAAADLVRAAPDSAEEHAAMNRLRPVVAPCVPRDMPAHLDAYGLRDLLAEPVYHGMTGR